MKVAIVGSRDWPDAWAVIAYVNSLPEDTIVVSGGAKGVDTIAEKAARKRGLAVEIFMPDWATHGKAAGPIRNKQIIDAADRVVAFSFNNSKGTASSIDLAKAANKPLEVYSK